MSGSIDTDLEGKWFELWTVLGGGTYGFTLYSREVYGLSPFKGTITGEILVIMVTVQDLRGYQNYYE